MKNRVIDYPGNGRKYRDNARCRWTIKRNSSFVLSFTRFSVEHHSSCKNDYVQIGVGNRMGGDSIPDYLYFNATSPVSLHLTFKSNIVRTYKGFRVQVIPSSCEVVTTCPTVQDPICGSNNRSYVNTCLFQREKKCVPGSENMTVLHNGRCGGKSNKLSLS